MTVRFRVKLLAAAVAAIPLFAAAQEYPNRPIRLIVGFTAGGISDVLGRALAAKMTSTIGQSVVVENRPGAGTTIAADFTVKAPADGYTLFLQDITSHAINASLYPKLPYDSIKDFTPVALVASTPLMLVVHPSTPVKNVKDLVAYLKSRPVASSYGSSGNGTILHLTSEMFNLAAGGLKIQHIPYKGSGPATQAIMASEVSYVFSTMPPAIGAVKAGKLRALAVTTPKRVGAAPDVPTMVEAGVPGFESVLYSGVLAPPNLPRALVTRINAEFAKVVAADDIKNVYASIGADPITASPEDMGALMAREIAKLAPMVKASGARVE